MGKCYDRTALEAYSRGRIKKTAALCIVFFAAFVAFVTLTVVFNGYVWAFIVFAALAVLSLIVSLRALRRIPFSSLSSARGKICEVQKDVREVRGIVGGINPFGGRMYDSYRKNEIRMDIFIDDGDGIRSYHLAGITDKHAEYYESLGEAIHIFGAPFPVKEPISDEWLCPICGEFCSSETEHCTRCGVKALTDSAE